MTQEQVNTAYHKWYYNSEIWKRQHWRGVEVQKFIFDAWNYQELIHELAPALIVEIGTYKGGSALMFSDMLLNSKHHLHSRVLTIDINHDLARDNLKDIYNVKMLTADSTSTEAREAIQQAMKDFPGRVFAILDGDHTKEKVLEEMLMMREILRPGDYMIVEDGNINGHPVLPGWGDGPLEAIKEFEKKYPKAFTHDYQRERKFGITCAPEGYLIKN